MRRFLCLLLTLALMAAVSAACAEEEREIRTEGDYQYALLDDGTAEITAYWGCAEAVQIPAELGGKPVTRIGERAFEYRTFASVTIPEGVTDIGAYAFFTCDSLESVAIPDSVTRIGEYAFADCSGLTAIVPRGSFAERYCEENGIRYTFPDAAGGLFDGTLPLP